MNVKIIVLLCFMLSPCMAMSETGNYPDKIIATKNMTGRLVSFSLGDYAYVSLKKSNGTRVDFFVYDEVCSLAEHHNGLGTWDLHRDKWSKNVDYLRCHQELEQLSSK